MTVLQIYVRMLDPDHNQYRSLLYLPVGLYLITAERIYQRIFGTLSSEYLLLSVRCDLVRKNNKHHLNSRAAFSCHTRIRV